MTEPTDSGERVDYAIRYTAPIEYAGRVARIVPNRSLAQSIASHEGSFPGFACEVVSRTVLYGEWGVCDE